MSKEPYYCPKCDRNHMRGKIYEKHKHYKGTKKKTKPKDEDTEIESPISVKEKRSFRMKGKKGEDLKVRAKRIDHTYRIHIYKYDDLVCSTNMKIKKSKIEKDYIKNFIRESCF